MTAAKHATPRTAGLATFGPRAAVVSEALGAPFMPWQQQVADVALEVSPTDPGAWHYPLVVVTVPRQAGKTTLLRAVGIDRALTRRRASVFLTAQTGKDARARWRDWVEAATAPSCPLAQFVDVRRAAGTEALTFPTGSFVSPFAPTPKSLHGYTPPLVMVDECWAFDEPSGAALEAAISPAQITLPDRQLWLVSTMGDSTSSWWHAKVDEARELGATPGSGVAFFEWSAPDEVDPYSPQALDFHPAVGHTQRREDLLAQAARESPGNWRRGYLNLRTTSRETLADMTAWDELTAPDHPIPPLSECVLSYAVADDRSGASLWAAHLVGPTPCLHLVTTRTGSSWLTPTVSELWGRGVREVAADDSGYTRTVTAALEREGVAVHRAAPAEWATACASLLGRVADGSLAHDGSPELRTALEGASLRAMAGGRAFDDRTSAGPIDHLKAATLAAWRVEQQPAVVPI